ncbi:MAG: ABC transporter permease [Desulfurococcales archaeon]|nr:ABC transporter permease [Desulfurococcales archaeon]
MKWGVLSEVYVAVKSLTRQKGILFWVIVFPLLFYGLEVAIWGNPQPETITVGVVNLDRPVDVGNGTLCLGDTFVGAMRESGLFKVVQFNSIDQLKNAVKLGRVDIGVVVPEDFTSQIMNTSHALIEIVSLKTPWASYYESVTQGFVKAYSDEVRNRTINVALTYITGSIANNTANSSWSIPPEYVSYIERFYDFIKQPIRVSEEKLEPPLVGSVGGIRAYYAIGLMGIETLFIGLSMGIFAVIDMKREGTLKVLLSSPLKSYETLASLTLATLFYVGVSCLAIYLFSLPLGADYNMSAGTALATVALILVGALFIIGFGLLLAPAARTPEAATAIMNMIAFPIMFLGGFTVPTFLLPEWIQKFATAYPLSRTIEAVRQMLTYGKGPLWALQYSMPAIIATVVVYAVGVIIYNKLVALAMEG